MLATLSSTSRGPFIVPEIRWIDLRESLGSPFRLTHSSERMGDMFNSASRKRRLLMALLYLIGWAGFLAAAAP